MRPRLGAVQRQVRRGRDSPSRKRRRGPVASPEPLDRRGWKIAGAADFNGDKIADLLWTNTKTGEVEVWLLDPANTAAFKVVALPTLPDRSFAVKGIADFDNDGDADILWQHKKSRQFAFWEMDDTPAFVAEHLITAIPDKSLKIIAVADLDRDGNPDLLMRNTKKGRTEIWRIVGFDRPGAPAALPDTKRVFLAAGDFNGDGHIDLMWRLKSGEVFFWQMYGAAFLSETLVNLTAPKNFSLWPPSNGARSSRRRPMGRRRSLPGARADNRPCPRILRNKLLPGSVWDDCLTVHRDPLD